jgi:hypothetical protein
MVVPLVHARCADRLSLAVGQLGGGEAAAALFGLAEFLLFVRNYGDATAIAFF